MAEPQKSETAKREEDVLAFWNREKIFEKSLAKKSPKGEFVFYDGPPFATGLPHHGHLLGSTSKDLFGRYRTMRGYHVRRRWGWDTHGLPIETKVEEKLGLKAKKDILVLGIEKFNEEARSLVLEYVHEWKRYIERLGRWVDFDNSYKTMDASFTESVWWALKEIHTKGHLYEGRKVLMYCPHDETVLAKAEIAMDNTYKDVTDETLTVKFRLLHPEELNIKEPAFILAWTTTPWTLPGNVALAVGPDIEYAKVMHGDETFICAKERAEALGLSLAGADIVKGSQLAGQQYEPLYALEKVQAHQGKKWQVVSGDFVTTQDGTGIVHIATMYGEDDFAVGQRENLPFVQILNAGGVYNDDAPELVRGEYYLKGGKKVIEDLEARGAVFARASHTHSYPHCYRCGTRLIYNAVSSWFINIQAVKQKLLSENEKINWVPDHLKEGRFRHIVENAPDWTISRNRFWASPLPIWKDAAGDITVVGSLEELKSLTKKSGNRYFVMRHGEAENNAKGIVSSDVHDGFGLTEKGRAEVRESAQGFAGAGKITSIYASPFARTKESAEIAAEALGISKEKIRYDDRLKEFNFGDFSGKSYQDYLSYEAAHMQSYDARIPGGESYLDAKKRFGEFLYELETKHADETILIVSHGVALETLSAVIRGADLEASKQIMDTLNPKNAQVLELPFTPLPHNAGYELDFHLPYIDRVQLEKDGKPLKRIPEVVDCWVESGCMPFAEYNYPSKNKSEFEKRTPGNFISEYISQTRTWFYYMHAMGILLFNHLAFRNVVSTGTILAADGQKMSKSKGNFTDPMLLIDQFGSDAFRYYLMSSVVMQAEDFSFRDDDLRDVHNKVVNILRNTASFFSLYKEGAPAASNESRNVLDRWILLRLEEVTAVATESFDKFDTVRATRPMREFVEDFSTWYVRRSRERVKSDDAEDRKHALATLRYVLREFSKVIAPVMPFIADEIYRGVREGNEPESVHLAVWPSAQQGMLGSIKNLFGARKSDASLVADMAEVRELVSLALEARQKANIKVRQPLKKLKVNSEKLLGKDDLLGLIRDELNVKEVLVQQGMENRVDLDTEITPELREEGDVREVLRAVQDLRKEAGLNPGEKASLVVSGDAPARALVERASETLKKAASLANIFFSETKGKDIALSLGTISLEIRKP